MKDCYVYNFFSVTLRCSNIILCLIKYQIYTHEKTFIHSINFIFCRIINIGTAKNFLFYSCKQSIYKLYGTY